MPDTFRYAEHLLYSYPVNMMRIREAELTLARLREETDCHAQNYNYCPQSAGGHSDPVAGYHAKVDRLERTLIRLREETAPIEKVRTFLLKSADERDSDMLFVLELFYFEKMRLEDVALHLQKSVKTIGRRRQELTGLVLYELEHS